MRMQCDGNAMVMQTHKAIATLSPINQNKQVFRETTKTSKCLKYQAKQPLAFYETQLNPKKPVGYFERQNKLLVFLCKWIRGWYTLKVHPC